MPTFWQGENLIHFAAFKKHIGIYPGGEATNVFAERLKDYKTSKGVIQFLLDKPIDYKLIADITTWRVSHIGKSVTPNDKVYEYNAVIQSSESSKGGANVPFPYDIRAEFGKGRGKSTRHL